MSSYNCLQELAEDTCKHLNRAKALQDAEKNVLMKSAMAVEESMKEMASLITTEASNRIPVYNEAVKALGIDGDNYLTTRGALAEVMTYINPSKNFIKTANYFGLFKGKLKRYNPRARQALQRLSMVLGNPLKAREEKKNTLHRLEDDENP